MGSVLSIIFDWPERDYGLGDRCYWDNPFFSALSNSKKNFNVKRIGDWAVTVFGIRGLLLCPIRDKKYHLFYFLNIEFK